MSIKSNKDGNKSGINDNVDAGNGNDRSTCDGTPSHQSGGDVRPWLRFLDCWHDAGHCQKVQETFARRQTRNHKQFQFVQ